MTTIELDSENTLVEYIEKLQEQPYENAIASHKSLEAFETLLFAFNESIAEYNYEVNQLNTSQKLGLSILDKLSRLPAFPGLQKKSKSSWMESLSNYQSCLLRICKIPQ